MKVFLILSLASIFCFYLSNSIEDDVMCLKGVKNSLSDPSNKLSSWTFTNSSVASFCKLQGVACWNEKDNRLISLQLPKMQLSGEVPESLKYCQSLQTLDLSNNSISGPIPSQICNWLPYLVSLDLSRNALAGPIPPEIADCKFLNSLILSNNRLSGPIPYGLGRLNRLKTFSVVNNDLSGSVPADLASFDGPDFDGNGKLCGKPLGSKCGSMSSKSLAIIVAAGVVGAAASLFIGFVIWSRCG